MKNLSFMVFGANTDVGKTYFCKNLMSQNSKQKFVYLKPAETGVMPDSLQIQNLNLSNIYVEPSFFRGSKEASPHLEGMETLSDVNYSKEVMKAEKKWFQSGNCLIVETLGGPASPLPNGELQKECYQHLRMPVVLVGDGKLGGISATLCALESLWSLGYDIVSLVFLEGFEFSLENYEFVKVRLNHLTCYKNIFVEFLKKPKLINEQYRSDSNSGCSYEALFFQLKDRLFELSQSAQNSKDTGIANVWWPFTQHSDVEVEKIPLVESASGNSFFVRHFEHQSPEDLKEVFDASGSWWTQCYGHSNFELGSSVARAAHRYGHVLHPKTVVEPVAKLAQEIMKLKGFGWADRVFFADNGSTAIEVALKMAFRLREVRNRKYDPSHSISKKWKILGLKDSYHGDTLGAMNAVEESIFTKGFAWTNSTGVFVSYPELSHPSDWLDNKAERIKSANIFWENFFIENESSEFGAVLIEPIIHGSGGMKLIDPAFQQSLVQHARRRNIPVIFDEVFSGLFRLGVATAGLILQESPDIACYSKVLSGGMLPLGLTLATSEVFDAFSGGGLQNALLHGHSFAGNPISCAAALQTLHQFQRDFPNGNRQKLLIAEKYSKEVLKFSFVSKCWSMGSLFTIELKSNSHGYSSAEGAKWVEFFRTENILIRPLGNVLYFMFSYNSTEKEIENLFERILSVLKKRLF